MFHRTIISFFIWRDGYCTLGSGIVLLQCHTVKIFIRFLILFLIKPITGTISRWILAYYMRKILLQQEGAHITSAHVREQLAQRKARHGLHLPTRASVAGAARRLSVAARGEKPRVEGHEDRGAARPKGGGAAACSAQASAAACEPSLAEGAPSLKQPLGGTSTRISSSSAADRERSISVRHMFLLGGSGHYHMSRLRPLTPCTHHTVHSPRAVHLHSVHCS